MKHETWMNHPAMKNIDPRKLEVLMGLRRESNGISVEKSLPLIMKANAQLQAMNLPFTKDESSLIIEILSENMSAADKMKLETMKRMMGKMK